MSKRFRLKPVPRQNNVALLPARLLGDIAMETFDGRIAVLYGECLSEVDVDDLRETAEACLPGYDVIATNYYLDVQLFEVEEVKPQIDWKAVAKEQYRKVLELEARIANALA